MPEPIRYSLDNPHPLSQLKTELIWAGKYDAAGRKVAPVRVKLPFQTVETVNESSQQRQMALDLFSAGRPAEWRNRLIWGDKKYVLPALLDEFAGQVDLIYISIRRSMWGRIFRFRWLSKMSYLSRNRA